jgi:hypothetical protein
VNGYAIFAFVITPAIVLVLGYVALRLFEHSLAKRNQMPGE